MKRSAKYSLKFTTHRKKEWLNLLFKLYSYYLQKTIDLLWDNQIPLRKRSLSSKKIDWMDNLGGQYKQLIYKQASEIVRGCKFKKGRKKKPIIKNITINFDNRIVFIEQSNNSFDRWIRLRLPFIKEGHKNRRIEILIPLKEHKHSLKFKDWKLSNSVRLNKNYISLTFEKETPPLKQEGRILGVDCGYRNLITTSEGQFIGKDFDRIYEKISRKKQGSKLFKQALIERNNEINRIINKELNLVPIKTLKVEKLKDLRKGIKEKFRKKFNNKFQRWTYRQVLIKLERRAEEEAVQFLCIPPAYTSQTCCRCQFKHKNNRRVDRFKCLNCSYENHADLNAAINIANWEFIVPNTQKANEGTFVHRISNYGCSHFERGPAANRMVKYSTKIIITKRKEEEK